MAQREVRAVVQAPGADRRGVFAAWREMQGVIGHRGMIGALVVASVMAGLTESAILAAVAQVSVALVGHGNHVNAHVGPILVRDSVPVVLLAALLLALLRTALQWFLSYLPARITADVQIEWRCQLFDAFTDASWATQSSEREAHLQELMSNQSMVAIQGVLNVLSMVSAAFTLLAFVASAAIVNPVVAAVVASAAGSVLFLLRPFTRHGRRHAGFLSEAQMSAASGVGEAVALAEEIKVFGTADLERRRVAELLGVVRDRFFTTQLLQKLVPGLYQCAVFLLLVGGLTIVYVSGAHQIAALGTVVLMLVRAASYGQTLQGSYHTVNQMLPYVERITEATERYRHEHVKRGDVRLSQIRTIDFEDVSYGYRSNRLALDRIRFNVDQAEVIGIVGPSGAGKSTLVQLLLRLRDPQSGRYLLNDREAGDYSSSDWHNVIAYVPQEPRLLHATVSENIQFLRDIADQDVQRAARLARIHDEIMSWAQGYDTVVGQRADAVSGGQRQRLCLARALAARPQLLVLDEPTSALDMHSESLVQESLASLRGELTLFIVTHRKSLLRICDRIMVLSDGSLESFERSAEVWESAVLSDDVPTIGGSVDQRQQKIAPAPESPTVTGL